MCLPYSICESTLCLFVCLLAHVRSFVRWVCVKNSLVLWVKGTDFLENNVFKCIAEGIGLIEHHSMEIWFCVWIPQGPMFCSHKSWEQLKNLKKIFFESFSSLCIHSVDGENRISKAVPTNWSRVPGGAVIPWEVTWYKASVGHPFCLKIL